MPQEYEKIETSAALAQAGRVGSAAKREASVLSALKEMDKSLELVAAAASELNDRLLAVTRPQEPAPQPGGDRAPQNCELAAQIANKTDRLNAATELLNDISDRLEV